MGTMAGSCLLVLWALEPATGRESPAPAEESSHAEVEVNSLVSALEQEADRARRWRLSWTGINAGLTLLSVAGLFVLPRADRGDMIVASVTSAASTAFTWLWPLDVESKGPAAARAAGPDRHTVVRQALADSADDEAARMTWPWHLGNFVTALIPAGILWFGLHERANGAIALVSGFALGEAELLTQPTGLVGRRGRESAGLSAAVSGSSMLVRYRLSW